MTKVDIGFDGMRMTEAKGIEIHWRADGLPRPPFFYLEPDGIRHPGGGHVDISKYHQVDPSRRLTPAGVMPDRIGRLPRRRLGHPLGADRSRAPRRRPGNDFAGGAAAHRRAGRKALKWYG
jgi:hypothetical protein